tara:strand:- start:74 stop:469 length:396 start_codon:yes stop_codon:yes gene_type:complete
VNIIEQYISEIEKDLEINEFNIKESSMKTPSRKHFWVSKLIQHKKKLYKLQQEKENIKKEVVADIIKNSAVRLTQPVAEKASYKHPKIIEINQKINDESLIVEFLEKTEKTFSSISFDIKNIIEIMKMEQL